jgi:NAD(P)-dependent dehydrogenase (short-subunit alcohol dehydrogenase family)
VQVHGADGVVVHLLGPVGVFRESVVGPPAAELRGTDGELTDEPFELSVLEPWVVRRAEGGDGGAGDVQELNTDLVRKVINVNLLGTFWSLQAEITAMRAHGGGSIINLTSMAAFTGTDGLSAYNATKHAILGLTRTAALENAQQGIRVNTVAPGTIETPMTEEFAASSDDDVMAPIRAAHPMGRVGDADEVSGAILYLASDAATFTIGASISVDGGYIAR